MVSIVKTELHRIQRALNQTMFGDELFDPNIYICLFQIGNIHTHPLSVESATIFYLDGGLEG